MIATINLLNKVVFSVNNHWRKYLISFQYTAFFFLTGNDDFTCSCCPAFNAFGLVCFVFVLALLFASEASL